MIASMSSVTKLRPWGRDTRLCPAPCDFQTPRADHGHIRTHFTHSIQPHTLCARELEGFEFRTTLGRGGPTAGSTGTARHGSTRWDAARRPRWRLPCRTPHRPPCPAPRRRLSLQRVVTRESGDQGDNHPTSSSVARLPTCSCSSGAARAGLAGAPIQRRRARVVRTPAATNALRRNSANGGGQSALRAWPKPSSVRHIAAGLP
jgi:hypothetical protein